MPPPGLVISDGCERFSPFPTDRRSVVRQLCFAPARKAGLGRPGWHNSGMKKRPATRRMRQFTVVIEQDEDGYYVASVPSLQSCYTQARTLEELGPRIREVTVLCLAEQDAPRMKFIALERVEVSA